MTEAVTPPAAPPASPPEPPAAPPASAAVVTPLPAGDPLTPPAPSADDWRTEFAGEDPDTLRLLGRYTDKAAFGRAFKEQRDAIAKRGPEVPGADATDEQLAAFARAAGIPEKAEDYKYKLPDGVTLGDDEKTMVGEVIAALHKRGGVAAHPDTIQAAVDLVLERQDKQAALLIETADRVKNATIGELKGEWKGDYARNMEFANQGARHFFGDAASDIMDLRLLDGSALGAHPDVVRSLAKYGRMYADDPAFNDMSMIGAKPDSLNARKAEILKLRKSATPRDREEYARLSAPGGELSRINAALERASSASRAA